MSDHADTIKAVTVEKLNDALSERMKAGWLPQGSHFFDNYGNCWMQQIIKPVGVVVADGEVRLKEPKRK